LGTAKFGFWVHFIDIVANVGLKKPEISILSGEFLTDVSGMLQKNLAFLCRDMCEVVFNTLDEDGDKVLYPAGGTPQIAKQFTGGLLMTPWSVRG